MLNTYGKDALTLHPNDSFDYIDIKQGYYSRNYSKLFLEAIRTMKKYRRKQVV